MDVQSEGEVRLAVPAMPEFLRLARLTAAGLASRLGFTYDEARGQWTGLSGVNVTVGLPFLRVSVDHGTAFDRAWKGIANPESMREAIDVAVRMLSTRTT